MTVPVEGADIVSALTGVLPAAYTVLEAEGPKVPADSCPAIVVYVGPGTILGAPYAPGRDLTQTVSLIGIGETAQQATRAAVAGQAALLAGALTIVGRRVIFDPSDTQQPYPNRDDSLTPPVFTQAVLLNVRN